MANILLVQDGEPLPLENKAKKLRTAMLADELVLRGHHVTWFCSTFHHMKKEFYFAEDKVINISKKYKIILKNSGRYNNNISLARIKHHNILARKLKIFLNSFSEKFDIIVVSHPIPGLSYQAVSFAIKQKIPVITDVRDQWPEIFKDYAPKLLKGVIKLVTLPIKWQTQYVFNYSTTVVAMSQYMLNWANTYSKCKKNGQVFHLGTSLCYESRLAHTKRESTRKVVQCTYVGGLIKSYDLGVVLSASKLVNKRFCFNVVGDGACKDMLMRMPVEKNVNFYGWCDKEEMIKYFCLADILLLPLDYDTQDCMPNKLFDYLWAGKPILASCRGEMAELIRDEKLGYVFKFGDVNDFISGLNYLKDPEVSVEISSNISRVYRERFSAKIIYSGYAKLIESFI